VPRASTDLAANLAAAEVCCVPVGIGQTVAHGFQSGVEIARVNALRRGPGDICCCDGSRDGSFSPRAREVEKIVKALGSGWLDR
jgi:hypothetical protein